LTLEFLEVNAEVVQPLRTRVLRPGWLSGETLTFEADEATSTYHFGLVDSEESGDGSVVAVLTWLRQSAPSEVREAASLQPDEVTYRLRGMAVAEEWRGQGLGARLLESSLVRLGLKAPACEIGWCNARESAVTFYEKQGFEVVGERFEIEGIGPHRAMWRQVPRVMADGSR